MVVVSIFNINVNGKVFVEFLVKLKVVKKKLCMIMELVIVVYRN